jgi:hypothetical protein
MDPGLTKGPGPTEPEADPAPHRLPRRDVEEAAVLVLDCDQEGPLGVIVAGAREAKADGAVANDLARKDHRRPAKREKFYSGAAQLLPLADARFAVCEELVANFLVHQRSFTHADLPDRGDRGRRSPGPG